MPHLRIFAFLFLVSAITLPQVWADASTPLRFSVIITGESAGSLEAMAVDGGSWTTSRKLVHTAVYIQHPKGHILWDSGLGTGLSQQMEAFSWWQKALFKVENVHPAVKQLEASSFDPHALHAIIPSHMHWDHVSGVEDFAGVPIWVRKEERAESRQGVPPAFVKSQYDDTDLVWKTITLQPKPYRGFPYSLDVFDDNTLVLVDLSGHTNGQVGLFLNHPEGGTYFFIGDTAWTQKGVTTNRGRPVFVDWLVGVDSDFEKNGEQLQRIHALSQQDPSLIVVPAHDELINRTLPIFPEFH